MAVMLVLTASVSLGFGWYTGHAGVNYNLKTSKLGIELRKQQETADPFYESARRAMDADDYEGAYISLQRGLNALKIPSDGADGGMVYMNTYQPSEMYEAIARVCLVLGRHGEAIDAAANAVEWLYDNDEICSYAMMDYAFACIYENRFEDAKRIFIRSLGQHIQSDPQYLECEDIIRERILVLRAHGQDNPGLHELDRILDEYEAFLKKTTTGTYREEGSKHKS